ncbi:MAG: PD-(D/E)XK nuclease family protein [Planctomycetales bacterium]
MEILTGMAGSGKTARLLECYRGALADAQRRGEPGTTLWLTPTQRSQQGVLERLCDGTLPVIFSPNVLTFSHFAERILRAAEQPIMRLSPAMQRTLLRRIVERRIARRELTYFAPIAATSGFLDLVGAFIVELKRSETWPELFARACAERGERGADRELAALYRDYQETLLREGRYDGEGKFWSALQRLKDGAWGEFGRLSLVVVDGFTDFTSTQHQILRLLSGQAGRLLLSLPWESPLVRTELFAKPRRVRELLPDGADETPVLPQPSEAGGAAFPALDHVARWLFSNPRVVPRATAAEGLEIIAAAGEAGEVNLLAARVKELLRGGTLPDEIVIAVRDLADYYDLIVERFEGAGIPFACDYAPPLDRLPLCRALVQALQLELEDWPFDKLLAVLDSSYFRPKWLHNETASEQGQRRRDVAESLRWLKLSSGRRRILERLQRVAAEESAAVEGVAGAPPEATAPGSARRRAAAGRAWRHLERLSQALEGLRQTHSLKGWADAVSILVDELGFTDQTSSEAGAEDQTEGSAPDAGELLRALLYDAARTEELLDSESPRRNLSQFLPELTDLLHAITVPVRGTEEGRVRILSAEQVRNLDIPNLFLSGLTERSFPRHRADDCLYSERDRHELNRHGLSLTHRAERGEEEMLLFYSIVTRARRRLVLTYPVVTSEGEPLAPSPYLTALQDLFAKGVLEPRLEEQLDPIPLPERILSPTDARVRGMFDALEKQPGLLRAACELPAQQGMAANLLAAVDMHAGRFHTAGFTSYEGWLSLAANRQWVAERFSDEHEFSATQLEAYAQCPFQFFLSHVLQIVPLASAELETDYGSRGTLVHAVLAELHRRFFAAKSGSGAPGSPTGEEIAALFQQLIEEQLGARPELSELEQALRSIELRLLGEWGVAYGRQWADYLARHAEGGAPLPSHFELAFGTQRQRGETPPPVGTPPLVVGAQPQQVRIAGRIDRIDLIESEGATQFTVVDYKTGRGESNALEMIASGRALQLALYTLAVSRLQLAGPEVTPKQLAYWFIRQEGFTPGLKRKPSKERQADLDQATWDSLTGTLEVTIPRLVASMREARFPVYNADEHCTGSCPFHTVCRVQQIRALPEALGKEWSIDMDLVPGAAPQQRGASK